MYFWRVSLLNDPAKSFQFLARRSPQNSRYALYDGTPWSRPRWMFNEAKSVPKPLVSSLKRWLVNYNRNFDFFLEFWFFKKWLSKNNHEPLVRRNRQRLVRFGSWIRWGIRRKCCQCKRRTVCWWFHWVVGIRWICAMCSTARGRWGWESDRNGKRRRRRQSAEWPPILDCICSTFPAIGKFQTQLNIS